MMSSTVLSAFQHFDCECERCADPEELGAHTSTLLCSKCGGNMACSRPLDNNKSSAVWKCAGCAHTLPGRQVEWGNDEMRRQLCRAAADSKKSGPFPLEFFIERYQDVMHPRHSHLVEAKLALVQIYGKTPGYYLSGQLPSIQ